MVSDPAKRKVFKEPFYFRIKDVDIFNLKALYTMIHEWFVEEEYCEDEDKFPEIYMRERITPKRGKEVLIFWRFHKKPFGVEFYNRTHDVLIKLIGIKDVEVMQEGKKFKLQRGSFEVKVWSQLEYDAKNEWRSHSILKHFLEIFVNRIYKKEMEMHREELKVEVESLQNSIKEYLNLMRYDNKRPDIKNVSSFGNPYM
jgi:hypothetical protein